MKKTLSIISGISFVISGIATVVAFVCFCICQISQANEYAMFGEFMYKEMLLNITLVLAGLSLGMLVLFVVQVKCSPDRKKFAVAFAALLVVAGAGIGATYCYQASNYRQVCYTNTDVDLDSAKPVIAESPAEFEKFFPYRDYIEKGYGAYPYYQLTAEKTGNSELITSYIIEDEYNDVHSNYIYIEYVSSNKKYVINSFLSQNQALLESRNVTMDPVEKTGDGLMQCAGNDNEYYCSFYTEGDAIMVRVIGLDIPVEDIKEFSTGQYELMRNAQWDYGD